MAIPRSRVINGISPEVRSMLLRRVNSEQRRELEDRRFNSVALIQASIPDIYYFADIAKKAGPVFVADIAGTCPQHITTLAIFGDVAAVRTAVTALEHIAAQSG